MLFGLFSKGSSRARSLPFGNNTNTDFGARKMTLEERKQLRREMVYQSVREHMVLLEIISGMYKFKAVALDERHHRFMVVMDVTAGFVPKRSGVAMRLNEVEAYLAERAFSRYGVHIDSLYWRFHNTTETFARGKRPTDGEPAQRDAATRAAVSERAEPSKSVVSDHSANVAPPEFEETRPFEPGLLRPSSRHEPVSAEEMQAFEQAIASGVKPPPLRLGDLEYESDLAPLDAAPVVGGTQYGSL